MNKLLRYCLALVLILAGLAVLATVMHHMNFEGLMREIHGG